MTVVGVKVKYLVKAQYAIYTDFFYLTILFNAKRIQGIFIPCLPSPACSSLQPVLPYILYPQIQAGHPTPQRDTWLH